MKVNTLEKLYEDQMATMRNGQAQLQDLLPELLSVVTNLELRNVLRDAMANLREQTGRIEQILPENMITRQGNESPGMRGLIDECHAFLERASDQAIIDAGLVVCCRQILHSMIAGQASLRNFAILLNRSGEADSFQKTLDELAGADQELRRLALNVINVDALSAESRAAS